jgi:uncharacterized protein
MQKFYLLMTFWLAQLWMMQLFAQNKEEYVKTHYTKAEYQIPMRDGIKLFTTVYTPKDATKDNKYPILMQRTCYNVGPYGADKYENLLGPSKYTMEEKYIFVYQDVRGRWMSEGTFDNMRPQIAAGSKTTKKDIDESTDTYDTIDWLLKNVKFHNGKVGQWGISYPGFYAAVGTLAKHPALKASSPQAPIADFFFDDFHHQGAFILGYFMTFPVFGVQKDKNTAEAWYNDKFPKPSRDYYDFLLNMGSLKNADQYYKDNFFWQEIVNHPNYDEFWQKRNLLPHLRNIKHAVLTVGGWFDAEDLYGPLNIYKTIEKNNPGIYNQIVMGPWTHGDWARTPKEQIIGNIHFGSNISDYYQREIEARFFKQHLKGGDDAKIAEATLFDTGKKEWRSFDKWPAANAKKTKLYFHEKEKLAIDQAPAANGFAEFVSDPHNPVPYAEDLGVSFTPRKYMTDDQREASRRPDVVVFQTEVLTEDITLGGEIMAKLKVSVTGTDSDWIVKLIDVMPDTAKASEQTPKTTKLAGYQMLVRSEMMRGRFRNSFEKPEPLVPNQITEVKFPLQDVLHTFKKGHRIMIQVHSTWFPIIDRNPQKYVDNIYKAEDADFTKAMHRVYHANDNASYIEVEILDK